MQTKHSSITVSMKDYTNFKLRLPKKWLKTIGINENNKKINVSFKNNSIIIKKSEFKSFKDLSLQEKILQIKKFTYLYGHKFEKKKDLFNEIGTYFNISERTAYRYLKEHDESNLDLSTISLIEKQEENSTNINVMYVDINNSIVPMISLPPNLALLLFFGKNYEELGIKCGNELFKCNYSYPITMKLDMNIISINLIDENKNNHFL